MTPDNTDTPNRPVTIIDVAKQAGVSFKTVSRVLNGEPNVRQQTRDRVIEAVKTVGYRINPHARNLRAKGTRQLTIFFSNPSRNYMSETLWGAYRGSQAEGFLLKAEDLGSSDAVLDYIDSNEPSDGIILTPALTDDAALLRQVQEREIPFVSISPGNPPADSACVRIRDEVAGREMTEYLIALGHRRIGFVRGPTSMHQAEKRFDGYCEALEAHGIEVNSDYVRRGDFSFQSAMPLAERLLGLPERPTAIFCGNDDMAAAILASAYRARLTVPGDLSVVGFDDTPLATTISPALTTIRQPIQEMAAEAVRLLISQLRAKTVTGVETILAHALVERESAGPPS